MLLIPSVRVMGKLESLIDQCDHLKNVKCVVHCCRTNLLVIEVHKGTDIEQKVKSVCQKNLSIPFAA